MRNKEFQEMEKGIIIAMQDSKTDYSRKTFILSRMAEMMREVVNLRDSFGYSGVVDIITDLSDTINRIDEIDRDLDSGIEDVDYTGVFIDGDLLEIQYFLNSLLKFIVM